jgi:hypothetical protein
MTAGTLIELLAWIRHGYRVKEGGRRENFVLAAEGREELTHSATI